MNRARECFSCTLYSTVDKVPSTFLLGRSPFVKESTQKNFKRVQEQARLPRPFKSLFSLLDPLFDSTTLVLVGLLLNTRLYKAIRV